jgi:ribosome-associated heat shock protein Hsp15
MVRIDKYLWCTRIYKSRTLATAACDGGKVKMEGSGSVKPSYHVKPCDLFTVQLGFIKRTYRVKAMLEKRISAKLVTEYIEDLTPQEELDKLKAAKFVTYESRFKGTGRPTKKDRRLINQLRIKN